MNLLPKRREEFRSKDYWDEFFRKRTDAFEWYGEYQDLCGVLDKYCKLKDKLLMIGCGNSQLSEDLYDVGYRNLVNIDISEVVIKQMKEKNQEIRRDMEFIKMDILKMDFDAGSFNVVIDKGTLDAIFTDSSPKVIDDVMQMFKEVSRVLRIGGRYICITLAQDHILNKLVDHFTKGWFIRVHRILAISTDKQTSPLPVFAFVFTKTKFADNIIPSGGIKLLEICIDGTDKIKRMESPDEVKIAVKGVQQFAMIKQQINKMHPGESFTLELWDGKEEKSVANTNRKDATYEPRYTLTVKDIPHAKTKNGKFAIFIVPQGRETEWHFASMDGQEQLAADAAFERLVIVCLSRRHTYTDMDAIKSELSSKVMELAPLGVSHKAQVPFLSLGDDVGRREILYEGYSELSGGFVVEEVICDRGQKFRRLIFLNHRTAIQSEVKIVSGVVSQPVRENKNKKKRKKPAIKTEEVDFSYLACGHHRVMITSLALLEGFLNSDASWRIMLVGLGGGGLPMFMHKYFPKLYLEVVELDPSVVEIAQNWFGFVTDERMTVTISDGLEFIALQSSKDPPPSYDIIMFDIDSKDTSEGVVSPPEAFLETNFLASVKSILSPSGVLVLNLGCRNTERRRTILNNVMSIFPKLCTLDIEEEVNEVVFCLPETKFIKEQSSDFKEMKHFFQKIASDLENIAKEQNKERWDSTLDFCQSLENLKLFEN